MTTLAKQPPKRTRPKNSSQKRYTPPVSVGTRFKQRVGYWFRHPLNATWGWLSSVRTAIILIAAIAAICLLGIYFPQAPGEALNDATTYANWVQLNELPKYGSLTPIFDWMHFFTIFSSWYFMLLLVILALSIVVCTLNRAPAIWQNFRHPILRRSDKFYENALERGSFEIDDPLVWLTQTLRKRGYRVRKAPVKAQIAADLDGPSEQSEEVHYLYASKNTWATLATFVFHAALVTLLLAGAFSQWRGFAPDSPARRILPAPLVGLTDNLAGFTFDQALPNGTSAMVYPRGTPHNISFRVNSFHATFDPKTNLATDYVTDLSVYQDGLLVAHSNHLRVNDPLTYNGVIFHQSSLISAVNVTIADANGCLVCNQAIVLDQTQSASNLQVDFAKGIPIAGTGLTLGVFFVHVPKVQIAQLKQPPLLLLTVGAAGGDIQQGNALRLQSGQSGTFAQEGWKVSLNSASEATVLLVTRDTGTALIWPTAILLILSLCISFYFPQRRIWIKVVGQRVQLAALREHFVSIRIDILALEKASRHLSPTTSGPPT